MKSSIKLIILLFVATIFINGCTVLKNNVREPKVSLASSYNQSLDSNNVATLNWREFFKDEYLIKLIDLALTNNQELNKYTLEVLISKNEILSRKGEYLPMVNVGASAQLDKVGRYTRSGAVEENLTMGDNVSFTEPFSDFLIGFQASWEIDIWKKLRNAKNAAKLRYLSSVEGRNLLITQLVSEIAESYYELIAMDNLLKTINENIEIQSKVLNSIKLQKESAKETQLAVNRFEAQLLNSKNLQYEIKQKIVETENHISFLIGEKKEIIERPSESILEIPYENFGAGVPSQLLQNRPDIKQAELNLAASKLDVNAAKANFFPSLSIHSGIGYNAFNPVFLFNPHSLLYNAIGDLMAPLINRNAIKAVYLNATSKQLQAVISYEQVILNSVIDVQNQLSKIKNYSESIDVKSKEVDILNESIKIANNLFNSARADYIEVLLTQREALNAKMELIETKLKLLNAKVNLYRALGGGWR